jgi:hypothetical protein
MSRLDRIATDPAVGQGRPTALGLRIRSWSSCPLLLAGAWRDFELAGWVTGRHDGPADAARRSSGLATRGPAGHPRGCRGAVQDMWGLLCQLGADVHP